MIKKILLVLVALLVTLVVVILLQPDDFRITRSATMAAPAAGVFEQVNNFQRWGAWSPWEKLDPNIKRTFEGPESGVGATYSWAGDGQAGEGRMTIVESRPGELVRIKLEFIKPFAATNAAEFTFKPSGNNTEVTWDMSGEQNFLSKGIGLVMDMDKMVGGEFEKGLANLKAIVEAPPQS